MVIEVDMKVQFLTVEVLVRAAPDVIGIIDQVLDARDPSDKREESTILHQLIETAVSGADLREVRENGLAPNSTMLIGGVLIVERREFDHQLLAEGWIEKRINDNMPERLIGEEFLPQLLDAAGYRRVQGKNHFLSLLETRSPNPNRLAVAFVWLRDALLFGR